MAKSKKPKKEVKSETISTSEIITTSNSTTMDVTVNGTETPNTITFSSEETSEHGHIEGRYWVWPDGLKTPMRFIQMAIQRCSPLPKGFYEEAAKIESQNMKILIEKAKALNLKDTVENHD